MTAPILDVAHEIQRLTGEPIDALAVSLWCEFLARAVSEDPALPLRRAGPPDRI
jgi:hypothetical protein